MVLFESVFGCTDAQRSAINVVVSHVVHLVYNFCIISVHTLCIFNCESSLHKTKSLGILFVST